MHMHAHASHADVSERGKKTLTFPDVHVTHRRCVYMIRYREDQTIAMQPKFNSDSIDLREDNEIYPNLHVIILRMQLYQLVTPGALKTRIIIINIKY